VGLGDPGHAEHRRGETHRNLLLLGELQDLHVGLLHDRPEPVVDLVKEGNRIQFSDKKFIEEFLTWIRFTKKDVKYRKDGLTAEVMGFPYIPRWFGRFILKTFAKPESEAIKSEKQIRSSPLLMLFISRKNDKKHWLDVGRSEDLERARAHHTDNT
jgi:hypothetical protein